MEYLNKKIGTGAPIINLFLVAVLGKTTVIIMAIRSLSILKSDTTATAHQVTTICSPFPPLVPPPKIPPNVVIAVGCLKKAEAIAGLSHSWVIRDLVATGLASLRSNYRRAYPVCHMMIAIWRKTDAEAIARAKLRRANADELEITLGGMGDPRYQPGVMFGLTGLGTLSGNFLVQESRHNLGDKSGWKFTARAERRGASLDDGEFS